MATLLKEIKLIKTEVESNNNKFWTGKLFDDGSWTAEWGRVGYSGDNGQWDGESKFESKVKSKIKKGYTELKTIGSPITSSGASSISIKNSELHSVAKSQIIKS